MIGGHTCVHIICWPFGTLELCQPSKPYYWQGKLRNGSQALYFLYVVETTGPRPRPCCKRIKKNSTDMFSLFSLVLFFEISSFSCDRFSVSDILHTLEFPFPIIYYCYGLFLDVFLCRYLVENMVDSCFMKLPTRENWLIDSFGSLK